MKLTRRVMLQGSMGGLLFSQLPLQAKEPQTDQNLKGEVGVTTGSFMAHLSVKPAEGKLRLLDLPKIMRDELDMRVIDLMTATLASMKPDYLESFRAEAEDAGCIITNLKMNQRGLDMASPDQATRHKALTEYKRTIDAAEVLGCRWVRPIPGPERPDLKLYASAYQELIEYAAPKGISLLIENFGWISSDPNAIPEVIQLVGPGIHPSPDTGNWTDEVRYEGLAEMFPDAVTCDFKAFPFDEQGKHPRYDLKKCFQVGWDAGFRGPWCLEHFSDRLDVLLSGMIRLRSMIHEWSKQAE